MASGEAPNAPDLITFLGDTVHKVSVEEDDIPTDGNFKQVQLTGGASIYIVYDVPDLSTGFTPKQLQIVTSTDAVPLEFTPRSTKGHYKEGIILFETFNYGGRSQCYISDVADLTNRFPTGTSGKGRGISSFMVISGKWQLFKGLGAGPDPIRINGKDTFGPGDNIDLASHSTLNDSISSMKRVSV